LALVVLVELLEATGLAGLLGYEPPLVIAGAKGREAAGAG